MANKNKTNNVVRIVQCNVGRRKAAQDLIGKFVHDHNIQIVIVPEPNVKAVSGGEWIVDKNKSVAIKVWNRKLQVHGAERGEGWVRLQLDVGDIYGVYISPNIKLDEYKLRVRDVMQQVQTNKRESVIAGDINARSQLWGGHTADARGQVWEEWLAALNMTIANDGQTPTFIGRGAKTFPDITATTQGINLEGWKVLPEENLSDHKTIKFEVKTTAPREKRLQAPTLDPQAFANALALLIKNGQTNQDFLDTLKKAGEAAKVQMTSTQKSNPYWWCQDIEQLWCRCNKARRLYVRAGKNGHRDLEAAEYKSLKTELRKTIRKEKAKKWRELCENLKTNVWGKAYQVVKKSMGAMRPFELSDDKKTEILQALFGGTGSIRCISQGRDKIKPLKMEEFQNAAAQIKLGRAPGPDFITGAALKRAVDEHSEWFLVAFNNILQVGRFPKAWKVARVVLIPKGTKTEETPSSFRPISLLSEVSKLFERCIKAKLEEEIEKTGGLSSRQFGFLKGRSTLQALKLVQETALRCASKTWCILITLDVKNAFNSIQHKEILAELKRRKVNRALTALIADYLRGRAIMLPGGCTMTVRRGVAQGSVLGPTLWNIVYNGVLELPVEKGVTTIGYADDLAILIVANTAMEATEKGNKAMADVDAWLQLRGLDLAPAKTEAVALRGRRDESAVWLQLRGQSIPLNKTAKYLGVTFGHKGRFREHLVAVTTKATKQVSYMCRLFRNIGGPPSRKRAVMQVVAENTALYAAPIWASGLKYQNNRLLLERVQRNALLRVASAYNTTSLVALQVITGSIPIDLIAEERTRIVNNPHTNANTLERVKTMEKWQARWDEEATRAQWTKRLIPNIDEWVNGTIRHTNYYITQALTGHGSFRHYTMRIGKETTERCAHCNAEIDTPFHTLFECAEWQNLRTGYELKTGKVWRIESIKTATKTDEWQAVTECLESIMARKEQAERQRQKSVQH